MTYVRNIDRKIKVQTEESFQKTIMDEIKNFKKFWNKSSRCSNKFTILMMDIGVVIAQFRNYLEHQALRKKRQKNGK